LLFSKQAQVVPLKNSCDGRNFLINVAAKTAATGIDAYYQAQLALFC